MVRADMLRFFPYFAVEDEWILEDIASISEERSFRAGQVLFQENQPASHLYIVVEGEVDIQFPDGRGGHTTVDTLVKGDLMVWSALVKPHTTHSTAVARQDTRVITIKGDKLRELMDEDPVLGSNLMYHVTLAMSERLEGVRMQLATWPRRPAEV